MISRGEMCAAGPPGAAGAQSRDKGTRILRLISGYTGCVILLARLRSKVAQLKVETSALYLALRDPRTPWHAKALGAIVVAYALSPIDLIPDFVPVLGYVDDMILLPLGIWLTMRLIPPEVMAENRRRARAELQSGRPRSWAGAIIIVLMWIGAIGLTAWAVQALGRLK